MAGSGDERPLVMGVLNVTPDSFSDGGRYLRHDDAIARGLEMVSEGADLIDVGGESSRPGASPVEEAEELLRVIPVVEALAGEIRVSVDTVKERVAKEAVSAGATLINDIAGRLWPLAGDLGVGWVSMHMQGTPADMQLDPRYQDVVAEVHQEVLDRARRALAAGVGEVWVDPGIGFRKTSRDNLLLLRRVGELADEAAEVGASGVLVGTSRKGFLRGFKDQEDDLENDREAGAPLSIEDRLEGSLATAVWCMTQRVGMVRVHDVGATVDAAGLVSGSPDAQRTEGRR